jgi:hypothetical protein
MSSDRACVSVACARQAAPSKRAELKARDTLYLVSMAGTPPTQLIEDAIAISYLPFGKDSLRTRCAALLHIPNNTAFCPPTLLDAELLRNYYIGQVALDATASASIDTMAPPGAIYLDALDAGGTIRCARLASRGVMGRRDSPLALPRLAHARARSLPPPPTAATRDGCHPHLPPIAAAY